MKESVKNKTYISRINADNQMLVTYIHSIQIPQVNKAMYKTKVPSSPILLCFVELIQSAYASCINGSVSDKNDMSIPFSLFLEITGCISFWYFSDFSKYEAFSALFAVQTNGGDLQILEMLLLFELQRNSWSSKSPWKDAGISWNQLESAASFQVETSNMTLYC